MSDSGLFGNFGKAPVEPGAEIRQAAQMSMQIYRAYLDEGFTRKEAMELTKAFIAMGVEANRDKPSE